MRAKSLLNIFNKTAADACRAFPDILNRFLVFADSFETPLYISPMLARYLKRNTDIIREVLDLVTERMRFTGNRGSAYPNFPMDDDTKAKLIAIKTDVPVIYSSRYTKDMLNIFIFDHEIGHFVVKNGYTRNHHLNECAADAFAALRHIQRFGLKTELFSYYNRAHGMVIGGSPIHYTDMAVQRVRQLSMEMDVRRLSLCETAALAEKIAHQCRLSPTVLAKVSAAYLPVKEACKKHMGSLIEVADKLYHEDKEDWSFFCKKVMAVVRKHRHDPDIFRAGHQFLMYPPRKKFMEKMAKTDPYWAHALDFLARTDEKFQQKIKKPSKALSARP